MEKDYYELLNVTQNDSKEIIKQNFQQLLIDIKQEIKCIGRNNLKSTKFYILSNWKR